MPPTALFSSPEYLQHDSGPGHPECPQRLQHAHKRLEESGIQHDLLLLEPTPAPLEALVRVHSENHVERIETLSQSGGLVPETPDTVISPATFSAARLASGASINAVDAVMRGDISNAFCLHRPPGHHAEHSQAMGFCYFNHIAVAAAHLLANHGLKRVAIIDWDVHHGNGTQHTFEASSEVMFCSIHQSPHWPYTGARTETGDGAGQGHTLNIPVAAGSDGETYFRAFNEEIWSALESFRPEFILLSAGFDAHRDDPLGNILLTAEDFAALTRSVKQMSASLCEGRLVSLLEGGYDWQATAACIETHVRELSRTD